MLLATLASPLNTLVPGKLNNPITFVFIAPFSMSPFSNKIFINLSNSVCDVFN